MQLRLRRGRVALSLSIFFLVILFYLASGPGALPEHRFAELKAYGSSLRDAAGFSKGKQDHDRHELPLTKDSFNFRTDDVPDDYRESEKLPFRSGIDEDHVGDEDDFLAHHPHGKLEPPPPPPKALPPRPGSQDVNENIGLPHKSPPPPPVPLSAPLNPRPIAGAGADTGNDELPRKPQPLAPPKKGPPSGKVVIQGQDEEDRSGKPKPQVEHWTPVAEHYPVPIESLIHLPTGTPQAIPRIQHHFDTESSLDRQDREEKLAAIRAAFNHTWSGYRTYAWGHDELMPVQAGSGFDKSIAYRDPFGGWGATLVDSLDTLWIMGFKDWFEEAVEATMQIDFTTSTSDSIPVFETTIRYMGGLLGAYDISGHKYEGLLTKAVELAEILMGTFDTPNRMPVLFYNWRPQYASQPKLAPSDACMAEAGSLALEFTRLAQLTGQPKYYDAVARVMNYFDEYQDRTWLPGLWPLLVDISGCANPTTLKQMKEDGLVDPRKDQSSFGDDSTDATKLDATKQASGADARKDQSSFAFDSAGDKVVNVHEKRQDVSNITMEDAPLLDLFKADGDEEPAGSARPRDQNSVVKGPPTPGLQTFPNCVPFDGIQNTRAPHAQATEEFGIGGRADSTYEYLPKEWLLLSGHNDQYRKMYEKSLQASKEYLYYEPMINDTVDVTFSGTFYAKNTASESGRKNGLLDTKTGHLNCFAGGMVALGAKIYNRDEDMKLAERLAEGCAWEYGTTTSGVMPEEVSFLQCPKTGSCAWNETAWHQALDPTWASRQARIDLWEEKKAALDAAIEEEEKSRNAVAAEGATLGSNTADDVLPDSISKAITADAAKSDLEEVADPLRKRQLETEPHREDTASSSTPIETKNDMPMLDRPREGRESGQDGSAAVNVPTRAFHTGPVAGAPLADMSKDISGPAHKSTNPLGPRPQTHEQAVKAKLNYEKLYPGMMSIRDKRYLLRPEAIESVFYLYRISGDRKWRDYGWKMFKAVDKLTRTKVAASTVLDVNQDPPFHTGALETFWTGETLKYFYLLFESEDVVSLDEFVLNTEAHMFRLD